MEPINTFNPFHIFDRVVVRKFTMRARDYCKYTQAQLDETIPWQLRVFEFDHTLWYLSKDACVFLGLPLQNVTKICSNIPVAYQRSENVSLNSLDSLDTPGVSRVVTRNVVLLNEAGVYALIRKSQTTYALQFKEWLDEVVLPTIRETGSYAMAPDMDEERKAINSAHDNEVFGLGLMTPAEVEEELKQGVVGDDDVPIPIAPSIPETVAGVRPSVTLDDLMTCIQSLSSKVVCIQESTAKKIEEINATLRHMQRKLDIVIVDRAVKTDNTNKHGVFIIYNTGVPYNEEKKEYPYCIVKCHQGQFKVNERRVRNRYPKAKVVFKLENPNAESMYQVLKERAIQGMYMKYTSFYLSDDVGLDRVLREIEEIENERTHV